jgi:4'-phosphopantetheinyl transferase
MPLFRKSQLTKTTSLGIWKIEETADTLRSNIQLTQAENNYYQTLRSDLRKKHWLSYRNILKSLMDNDSLELFYDPYGKPHSVNKNYHLSVTHSGIFSAVIVSNNCEVGIDIEMLKDRIERVKEKFLSEAERSWIGEHNRLEKLYICWGSKESLYKLNGKPEVEFGKDIIVEPFEYRNANGQCTVRMKTGKGIQNFQVFYEKINDYMLVYTWRSNNLLQ